MDAKLIIDILQIAACLILGGLALYFKQNEKLKERATELIAEAETVYKDAAKAGGQKHEYVVNNLYSMIPSPLKIVFTKDMIATIVDNAFQWVESYAKDQLDRVVDKIVK